MNKPKKPNIAKVASVLRRSLPAFLALACLVPAVLHAFQLKDIELVPGTAQTSLKLTFAATSPSEGEYPLYFQKVDPSRGTLTISFLDTESPFPLGRHAVEAANPAVEEVLLKRVTSPSGKNFLGVELRLKEPPAGEVPVQPQPKGVLKVMVGKGGAGPKDRKAMTSGGKSAWSLAKSVKAREEYLNAKAEPAPGENVPNKVEARPAEPAPGESVPNKVEARPAAPSEPAAGPSTAGSETAAKESPGAEPKGPETAAAEASSESGPASLKEIKLAVTRSQEDLVLVFEPSGSTPVHTAQTSPTDSSILEVTLDGVASGLSRKEYKLPGSSLFKKVRITSRNGNLLLRVQLAGKDPVHILPREGGLTLTGGGKGEAALPYKWTSAKPDAPGPVAADGAPDPVKSAHEDGATLDAAAGAVNTKGKGLSSSRIFSLGQGGKDMVLLKDSAALRESPSPKAKARKKLPIGEKVDRVDREGAWFKVISGADTGWVKASEAVYEDEMTEAQAAALQRDIAALAAKAEAARKRAEETAMKAAAAAAAEAEAKAAAEAEALAKAQAKAEAQHAVAEEAEPVRVAGPAAAPAAKALPEASAPTAEAAGAAGKGRQPSEGPRLSLAETPELASRLAEEKKAAEEEKMKVKPPEIRVAYNSYGRRDPFIPVDQGVADNGIDIDQMKVVGIIWQAQEPMAVLEHNRESGVSFTVKQGDPVHNGRVSRITRDQVTFDISEYGISRSYSLKLVSNKEGKKQ